MSRRLFLPTARQTNGLLAIGFVSVGYALYLRYLAIEPSTVGLACEAGLNTWLCLIRKTAISLFSHSVFGMIALGVSVLNLVRPSIVLFAIALAAAGAGIVLYNVTLSALAVALLILSLARPVSAAE
ncbi:MAG: hypothetical protein QOD40_2528 [Alphaproteobacteria bacterium]|jgi:hypothetical protein|nr:hypothetical protein [Alphaproteobacteria bacterium]